MCISAQEIIRAVHELLDDNEPPKETPPTEALNHLDTEFAKGNAA
jgi:hypothetical protein